MGENERIWEEKDKVWEENERAWEENDNERAYEKKKKKKKRQRTGLGGKNDNEQAWEENDNARAWEENERAWKENDKVQTKTYYIIMSDRLQATIGYLRDVPFCWDCLWHTRCSPAIQSQPRLRITPILPPSCPSVPTVFTAGFN